MIPVALLLFVALAIITIPNNNSKEQSQNISSNHQNVDQKSIEYPITDVWVNKYNVQTGDSEFAACGYVDEYTSIVKNTNKPVQEAIEGTTMYMGTIIGYQNTDKTMLVYQVNLPELGENFLLTNDNFEMDFSGQQEIIEVDGWIYLDGTDIIAVSPLYITETQVNES